MSGSAASCGCAAKNRAEDLTGKRFGGLTVLRRAGNGRWRCRCSCGKELEVPAGQLKNGKTQSCGCGRHGEAVNRYDLTGRRFGRLTALYPVRKEGRVRNSYWHCKCDCGNELDVYTGSLLRGRTQSCGCWNREQSGKMHGHMHYRDETCVEILRSSCEETGRNKAGFRGLFLLKNGKYRASITFQGKHYDLGHYASFDRAVQARLEAEEVLHRGYLRAFERYGEKAKADRDWAENNPFFYQVRRVNGEFLISTNGE